MAHFQQDDSEVMHEEKRIGEANGKRDDAVVVVITTLDDANPVEEPKREGQHKDEKENECSAGRTIRGM